MTNTTQAAIDTTTCQICQRPIKSKNGLIAHHGYKRPGDGWQSASCCGARHEPLETSHAFLEQHIEDVTAGVDAARKFADAQIDSIRLSVGSTYLNCLRSYEYTNVTKENFDSIKAKHVQHFRMYHGNIPFWDDAVRIEHERRLITAKRTNDYLMMQCGRLAEIVAHKSTQGEAA